MSYTEFIVLALTSLLTMMNPLSIIPIYSTITEDLDDQTSKNIAFKATLAAFLTLIMFAFAGHIIFNIFDISVNALRIVGSFLFLGMGFDMLQAKISRLKKPKKNIEEFESDIAITPLGIPLICGPGAITVTMILVQDSPNWIYKILLVIIAGLVSATVYFSLVGSKKILRLFGPSGTKVMTRIMGLILMIIAVEFFFAGVKPFIRDILKI